MKITATLLPIRSVGAGSMYFETKHSYYVENLFLFHFAFLLFYFTGDILTHHYVLGLSTDDQPDWKDLLFLSKLILRILPNINRVCYVFGGSVKYPVTDITNTRLNDIPVEQLRHAYYLAETVSFFFFFFSGE